MADVYSYILSNSGSLAVLLNCESILKHFKFNDKTVFLKKSVENSIEKCIATDVVDSLLKCDEDTIDEFIETLHKTGYLCLTTLFSTVDKNSNKRLLDYKHEIPCRCKIPHADLQKLKLNYSIIQKHLTSNYENTYLLICALQNKKAISMHLLRKLNYALCRSRDVTLLMDAIINGNEYRYTMFRKFVAKYYPELIPYL